MSINKGSLKVFFLTWFSYAFFSSSMMPLLTDLQRSPTEWILRGLAVGFFVGAATAFMAVWKRRKHPQALPNEEL
jgi:protein-S-isoprenylcysteine O-methyltransferase Ste14